jgi:cytochrome b561
MSIGLLFWVLMVLWFFSWLFNTYGLQPNQYPWAMHASSMLFFVLLFLLGWKVFGFVIHA